MMNAARARITDLLWHDRASRDEYLRRAITDRLTAKPAPRLDDAVVATYFFAFRSQKLR